jgi:hypothetical protein
VLLSATVQFLKVNSEVPKNIQVVKLKQESPAVYKKNPPNWIFSAKEVIRM